MSTYEQKNAIENDKNGTKTGQNGTKPKGVKHPKTSVEYWKTAVAHRPGLANGLYYLRLREGARDAWICTDKSDRTKAATIARDHWVRMKAVGLSALLVELNPPPVVAPKPVEVCTVGQLLTEARAIAVPGMVRPRTFALYEAALRKITADVAGIKGDKSRFDHKSGGAGRWRARVDAVSMSTITAGAVERWRSTFITAGADNLKRTSREMSASSYIRNCRGLFAKALVEKLSERLTLPTPSPFAGIKLVESVREYEQEADPRKLYAAAWRELKGDTDTLCAFCLLVAGGLRRAEADLLPWSNVAIDEGKVKIADTVHFKPKSKASKRTVHLPSDVIALLKLIRKQNPDAEFVLAGGKPPSTQRSNAYRASCWETLSAWLRSKGIKNRIPLHSLRKMSGSLVNERLGLVAAQRHLGHRDLKTTAKHYIALSKTVIDLEERPKELPAPTDPAT